MTSRTLVATLTSLLLATPALGNCWIDHVELEGDGVRVIFSDGDGHIFGTILSKQSAFVIGHKQITWINGPMKDQTERGVLLMKGEVMGLSQGPEDNCTVEFATPPRGVTAHATLNPPLSGDEPQETTMYIRAEPPAKH
jgi:hypothetical protein